MADKIVDTWTGLGICPVCTDAWFNGIENAYGLEARGKEWIRGHRNGYTLDVTNDLGTFGTCDMCGVEDCVFGVTMNKWA